MADNISIAGDLIGTDLHQRTKQTLGPDGTATGDWGGRVVTAALGAAGLVDLTQSVVRKTATPTVSNAVAYASGDAVGGLLTFSNAARASGVPFVIKSVTISDLGKQSAALTLVLFDRTFTATADNAAFDPTDADILNHVGAIEIVAADYSAFNDSSAATWPQTTAHAGLYVVPNGTDLFGQLVTYGTPTYTSTTDLTVSVTIAQ